MTTGTVNKDERGHFPKIIEQPVMWGNQNDRQKTNRYRAIVDADTGKLFSIVSRAYRVIKHEDAMDQVEDVIAEGPHFSGLNTTHTEFYNDGGRMRRTYRFTQIPFEIAKGDIVNPELHLFNSYDTTWPFMVLLGAFRMVCTNGLVVGKEFLHLKKRHVYGLEQLGLKDEINTALKRFSSQTDQWRKWADRPLTQKTHDQFMMAINFGKSASEEIAVRVKKEAEGFNDNGFPIMSLWIFFNILTWYITHRAVSLNHRVEMEKRLRTTMGLIRMD